MGLSEWCISFILVLYQQRFLRQVLLIDPTMSAFPSTSDSPTGVTNSLYAYMHHTLNSMSGYRDSNMTFRLHLRCVRSSLRISVTARLFSTFATGVKRWALPLRFA